MLSETKWSRAGTADTDGHTKMGAQHLQTNLRFFAHFALLAIQNNNTISSQIFDLLMSCQGQYFHGFLQKISIIYF